MIDLHKLDKFRLKDREREFYGCTGDSEHRADFRLEDETCEEWEEQNEICDVKHSPEVV